MAEPDGATPTGAASIPDLNDPNVRLDRASAMRAMAARRRETVLDEMAPVDREALRAEPLPAAEGKDDPDADPADGAAEAERQRLAAEAASASAATTETTAAASATPTAPAAPAEPRRAPVILEDADLSGYQVRTKVRGEERLVPLDELRTTAQKTDAADTYLREARATLEETKAVAAQFARQTADPNASATPSGTTQSDPSSEPDPSDVAIDSLFQGDEAKAKQSLRQAIKAATPAAGPDAGAIARQVETTLVVRSALRQFAKDHREIASDPLARSIADQFLVDELKQAGVTRLEEVDPERMPELLNAAGTRTKDYFRAMAGVPAQTQAQPTIDRKAQKATIDELPTAATRAASTVPTPPTPSDVIARMAAARSPIGQQSGR